MGDRHKMGKIEDIFPCLSQMTDFIALIKQQCIDEALMWMKRHGQNVFYRLNQQLNKSTTKLTPNWDSKRTKAAAENHRLNPNKLKLTKSS